MNKSIKIIQYEVKEWANNNFGKRDSYEPLLGIVEELGELSHSYNKLSYFSNEDNITDILDAIGDMIIYMCDYAAIENIDLFEIIIDKDKLDTRSLESYRILIKLYEHLGRLCHAHLKQHQKIRINENHYEAKRESLGDLYIYLYSLSEIHNSDLSTIINETWERVNKRDWNNNKIDGNETN